MNRRMWSVSVLTALLVVSLGAGASAGNKKIMAVRQAKVLSERGLVETIYGIKIRTKNEVIDIVKGEFEGVAESKTMGTLQGHKIDEVWDEQKEVAKCTAIIKMEKVSELTGIDLGNPDKEIKRVAFSTSNPKMVPMLNALRAAEIDAFGKLAEQILGMELESHTLVKNCVLESDVVRTKVTAAIFMAELVDYGWDAQGDATATFQINADDVGKLIDQKLLVKGVVKVTGNGAAVNDYDKDKPKVEKAVEEAKKPVPPADPLDKMPPAAPAVPAEPKTP